VCKEASNGVDEVPLVPETSPRDVASPSLRSNTQGAPVVLRFGLFVLASSIFAACRRQEMARVSTYHAPVLERAAAAPPYWPTHGWRDAPPESQGLASGLLADALTDARARAIPIHSVLVIRHGIVVLDASFYPFPRGSRHDVASVTKSVTSVIAGIALHAGALPLDTRVIDALRVRPTGDARRDAIRIEHLLAMQSGLDCGFGRSETELTAMQSSQNWVAFALALPMRTRPGSAFGYCSSNYHLVSAAVARTVGARTDAFAARTLWTPLGITNVYWPRDPQDVTHGWGDLQLEPRDLAKIGFLYLHGGKWENHQIVSPDWVARSTAPRVKHGERNLYGMGWWTHPDSPAGFFEAMGRGGQRLSVWPAKDIIVVTTGGGFEPGLVGEMLRRALVADTALTPDPAGNLRLRDAIARVAVAPDPLPVSTAPSAARISGRTYQFAANSLGLDRITLTFADTAAQALIELPGRRLRLPVGLDGRYRIAIDVIDDIHPGARGRWQSPSQFVLELDLIGKTDHYTLAMTFAGDAVLLDLKERTGLMHQIVDGRGVK
jgi:CubicO group peptidase (beta-lactamase class C family)